ncbi:thioredoxin domain-containing protein [Caproiciproducens sp. LBM24188]
MNTKKVPNKLIHEKSPYLLQHAYNPVNWFPWSEEAFAKAKAEDKPIFLSIGYSTCHWCHVMAHESFEDLQVAEVLNRNYVCIKVDREERPDVDAVYMAVCQAFNGNGGWPLTILMTPEQKPFWAGTYLPKTSQYGHMGLLEVLNAISSLWHTDKKRLTEAGENVVEQLQLLEQKEQPARKLDHNVLSSAFKWFRGAYDAEWGGFGRAPKFPTPCNLLFLLQYSAAEQEKTALEMVEHTLFQMYRGGIYDHIGGGFSRYSTDEKWLVPHFEKTLYDNALLAQAYLAAYRTTHHLFYRRVAEATLNYVLRELTDKQSGFYCGQDADSDGVEGKYYTFTPDEIRTVLGQTDGNLFCSWFGITDAGNFEGKNIPNLIANPRFKEENPQMEDFCKILYSYRLKRTPLHKDDKVLTAWSALMITALADAWMTIRNAAYLKSAQEAQQFLSKSLTDRSERLLHRWRNGESGIDGQLDDYAFYSLSLLRLYQATFDVSYLNEAVAYSRQMVELFFDPEKGGFYLYAKDGEQLISRPKEVYDGAMPSGNSVAAIVLTELFKLTGETEWQQLSQKQFDFLSSYVHDFPAGYSASLLAIAKMTYPSQELVCATSEHRIPPELTDFLWESSQQLPFVLIKTKANQQALAQAAPFTESYPIPLEGTAYYLCKNGACAAPVTSLQELKQMLH